MKQLITFLIILTSFMVAKPKFTDKQIAAMTPQYFSRNHKAPKLVGLKIYMDNGQFTSFQPYSCALKMQINTRYV